MASLWHARLITVCCTIHVRCQIVIDRLAELSLNPWGCANFLTCSHMYWTSPKHDHVPSCSTVSIFFLQFNVLWHAFSTPATCVPAAIWNGSANCPRWWLWAQLIQVLSFTVPLLLPYTLVHAFWCNSWSSRGCQGTWWQRCFRFCIPTYCTRTIAIFPVLVLPLCWWLHNFIVCLPSDLCCDLWMPYSSWLSTTSLSQNNTWMW